MRSTVAKKEETSRKYFPVWLQYGTFVLLMLELQHFASVLLVLHAQITAHASVSFFIFECTATFHQQGDQAQCEGSCLQSRQLTGSLRRT